MLQVWPLTSGPQSSPLLASAVAWTLPLVPAALWALCLVLPTGMLHPHPLVQVGSGYGLCACDKLGCTCMVDSCWHHLLRSGECCIALWCMGKSLLHPSVLMDLCCGQSALFWCTANCLAGLCRILLEPGSLRSTA